MITCCSIQVKCWKYFSNTFAFCRVLELYFILLYVKNIILFFKQIMFIIHLNFPFFFQYTSSNHQINNFDQNKIARIIVYKAGFRFIFFSVIFFGLIFFYNSNVSLFNYFNYIVY